MSNSEPNAVPDQRESPEPSRTDAVKEAIALTGRHPKCGEYGSCVAARCNPSECCTADLLRPVVAALAEAERKLAEQNRINDALAANNAVLMENLVHADQQFAAAEKRAKEAEELEVLKPEAHDHLSVRESYETMVGLFRDVGDTHMIISRNGDYVEESHDASRLPARVRKIVESNAALTRKLATAREAFVDIRHRSSGGIIWSISREAIAAIDAPAGEEGGTFAWLAERITVPGSPMYFGGDYWTANPNEAVRFARKQDAENAIRILPLHPHAKAVEHGWMDAPPPEPANAQGSEAVCFERHGFPGVKWTNEPRVAIPQPSNAQEGTLSVPSHPCDDAVERAAEALVKAHGSGRQFWRAIDNLRSVLDQRAKERS